MESSVEELIAAPILSAFRADGESKPEPQGPADAFADDQWWRDLFGTLGRRRFSSYLKAVPSQPT